MIKIAKTRQVPSTLLSQEIVAEKVKLDNKIAQHQEITQKDFNARLYGNADVKKQLRVDQYNKCAYCETMLNGGEIEHFRPKTAYYVSVSDKKPRRPAYYWLAYEWDNMLCSCHECNRIKSMAFPLFREQARDIANRNIQQEQPILLNPCFEDPADIMEYREFYVCPKKDEQGNEDNRAKQIIDDYLQLNREDLKELRRRQWRVFVRRMHDNNLDFESMLKKVVDEYGFSMECMEFLGMYTNQRFRNI